MVKLNRDDHKLNDMAAKITRWVIICGGGFIIGYLIGVLI